MSEESVSYGKEPKYQIGDLVEFNSDGIKGVGVITDYDGFYHIACDKGNGITSYVTTEPYINLLMPKENPNFKIAYIADKPMETPEHYKMAITPIEFIQKNGLNFCEGNIVKYVARHRRKNGKDDLLKARHYLDMLIEYEYPEIQDLDSGKSPTF